MMKQTLTHEERIDLRKKMTREERAAERGQRDQLRTVPVHGDSALTLDAYWASPAAATAWGVLEVDVGMSKGAYYATSLFWGFPSRDDAALVAAYGNTVHRAYDAFRHRRRQFMAFSAPPCTATALIDGGRALHLAIPSEFPVRHQPARWVEIGMLAYERHLTETGKEHARQDRDFMAYVSRVFFAPLNRTLPVAMFNTDATGCFVQPEGMEMRALTAGDRSDSRLVAPDAEEDEDDEDDDEDDEEDDDGEGEGEGDDEDDDDDAEDDDDDDDDDE